MFHSIEFTGDAWVDVARSQEQPLERMLVRRGLKGRAQLRPHILETFDGPIEAADLFFEDGSTARAVPFASLCFTE
jgi:hypothetical protein